MLKSTEIRLENEQRANDIAEEHVRTLKEKNRIEKERAEIEKEHNKYEETHKDRVDISLKEYNEMKAEIKHLKERNEIYREIFKKLFQPNIVEGIDEKVYLAIMNNKFTCDINCFSDPARFEKMIVYSIKIKEEDLR